MTDAKAVDLVARLRAVIIMVPKPGSESFIPVQPFWVTLEGGPHKDGDEAGLQYLPSISTVSGDSQPMRVQAHIYITEPLHAEAAQEIERLRSMLGPRAIA